MSSRLFILSCLSALLYAPASWGSQENGAVNIGGSIVPLPVAHVYVTSTATNSSSNQIEGFTVGLDGRLAPVPASPFQFDDVGMSVNGMKLFALDRTAPAIDSYSIGLDGGLTYLTSTNYAQHNPEDCGSAAWLFPDRTGADLYAMEFNGDCANNTYQSFAVQKAAGGLNYLGYANGGAGSFFGVYLPASFLGNNLYAYEATNNSCMYYEVGGFKRNSNGLLTSSGGTTTLPDPPDGYRIYIPTQLATDPTNHMAIALWAANPPGCSTVAQQIGSFTADANGNLTTTNISANMPSTSVTGVNDMKISPLGNLLAVGGTGGLQLFHFNGAQPTTEFTGLLTTDTINEMFWDHANHLYAISQAGNKLYVFNVTAAAYHEAPGSPYTINQPLSLAVQPR